MAAAQHTGRVARPNLAAERELWRSGVRLVAGLDEVGRGALAGPVVAAAVVLPRVGPVLLERLDGVRDSKQLNAAARCRLYPAIIEHATAVGVGAASPLAVDVVGIVRATQLAMVRALAAMPITPEYLLLDGFPLPICHLPQRAITRGDRHVLSIAAASIVAKVSRDAEMIALSAGLPEYGFDRHKGYSTAAHRDAIVRCGRTVHHRLSWALLRCVPGRQPAARQLALPLGISPTGMGRAGAADWPDAPRRIDGGGR